MSVFTYFVYLTMRIVPSTSVDCVAADGTAGAIELLNKNTLTTAGVILGAGTGVAGAALLTAALPAQMLLATGTTAALLYAGDRKSKDLPVFPSQSANTDTTAVSETVEAEATLA